MTNMLRAIDEWLMHPVGKYWVRYHFLMVAAGWAIIIAAMIFA